MVIHELAQLNDEQLKKLSGYIKETPMFVLTNLTDEKLSELTIAIRNEKERRFMRTFNIKDWPLPTIGQTRMEYLMMLHEEYQQSLMNSRMIADAVWGEYRQ